MKIVKTNLYVEFHDEYDIWHRYPRDIWEEFAGQHDMKDEEIAEHMVEMSLQRAAFD
jgi:hypothetical protein